MLLPLGCQRIPLQGRRFSDALRVGFKQEAGVQGSLRGGVHGVDASRGAVGGETSGRLTSRCFAG